MRFLFVVRTREVLDVFQAPVRALCAGGDEVLALVESYVAKTPPATDPLESELDGLAIGPALDLPADRDAELAGGLRMWIDYLRYFEPEFAEAARYRDRAGRPLPAAVKDETDRLAPEAPELRRALDASLRWVERSLPVPEPVIELLERERPDAVLVSPLLKRKSPQVPYLRAARRLGIPSALCVASWDNLTTTGVIHERPDLVMVWNAAQREEAERLHGIPAEHVAVTGAPRFDAWFDATPATSREEFCGRIGLPADRPYILYVASHKFTAPGEAAWISRWLAAMRRSGHPELRDVPVLVRPHPAGAFEISERQLTEIPGVVVYIGDGFADYYDSIYHAAAVVGINTSAMIEAAAVGRGIYVHLAKRYRDTQDGSLHFDHLRHAGGGLIVATDRMDEHAAEVAAALRGDDDEAAARRASSFLTAFIRPRGLDRPATPIMVEALRELASTPVEPAGPVIDDVADTLAATLGRGGSEPTPRKRARRRRSPMPSDDVARA